METLNERSDAQLVISIARYSEAAFTPPAGVAEWPRSSNATDTPSRSRANDRMGIDPARARRKGDVWRSDLRDAAAQSGDEQLFVPEEQGGKRHREPDVPLTTKSPFEYT